MERIVPIDQECGSNPRDPFVSSARSVGFQHSPSRPDEVDRTVRSCRDSKPILLSQAREPCPRGSPRSVLSGVGCVPLAKFLVYRERMYVPEWRIVCGRSVLILARHERDEAG